MRPYNNVSLVVLKQVPKGWKPIESQIVDDVPVKDHALLMAERIMMERGYDNKSGFGVYRRPVPSLIPYADSDRTLVELYAL